MNDQKNRLTAFDGLRGYFVVLTFFVHFIPYASGFAGYNFSGPIKDLNLFGKFLQWLQVSNYGVYGFFVLSGFLIARLALNKQSFSSLKFLWHRFMRIYPAFLISAIASGCIGVYYTHRIHIDTAGVIKNLFFLNGFFMLGEVPSLNFVTWSLFYEFLFYLTVPLIAFGIRKLRTNRVGALLVAYCITSFVSISLDLTMSYQLFFVGIAVASFSDRQLHKAADDLPEWLVIAFYIVTTSAYSLGMNVSLFLPVFCIAAPALIIKATYGDGVLFKIFNWKPLRRLGVISYSFYLMHATVIIVFFYILDQRVTTHKGAWALFGLPATAAITLVSACLLYLIAERPYFNRKNHSQISNVPVVAS